MYFLLICLYSLLNIGCYDSIGNEIGDKNGLFNHYMHEDDGTNYNVILCIEVFLAVRRRSHRFRKSITYVDHTYNRHNIRSINLTQMVFHSERQCVDNCRMDRRALVKLGHFLRSHGNLKENRNMFINELVVSFIHIITHNVKNRVLKGQIARSGETVSRQFLSVLNSVLKLHNMLLRKPDPIP